MAYEVDFLPVGDGERSGDALALRFGNLSGPRSEQQVWVIDGGTKDSGKALVAHIEKFYGTDRVDVVVSTHPDSDHAAGLSVVLEQMKEVGVLLMHQPWNHAEKIRHLFDDERVTPSCIEEPVWRALQDARGLEKIATRKGIPIREPFSDAFTSVLGPSKAFYEQQLAKFRCMPEVAQQAAILRMLESILAKTKEAVRAVETWFQETLADPADDATSAENNSSVVLLLELDGKRILFSTAPKLSPFKYLSDHQLFVLVVPAKRFRKQSQPIYVKRSIPPRYVQTGPRDGSETVFSHLSFSC